MRIAILAETYLPLVNGVTRSLQRVLEHLVCRGDEVLVIAPSAVGANDLDTGDGVRVVRLLSVSPSVESRECVASSPTSHRM